MNFEAELHAMYLKQYWMITASRDVIERLAREGRAAVTPQDLTPLTQLRQTLEAEAEIIRLTAIPLTLASSPHRLSSYVLSEEFCRYQGVRNEPGQQAIVATLTSVCQLLAAVSDGNYTPDVLANLAGALGAVISQFQRRYNNTYAGEL